MELRHLRYFGILAEELHFGRAAERLHIAQPPLSQQIRQLETELGFELFHRTKRKVQLTTAGEVFFAQAQQILKQLEQAIQMGRQTSRGEIGQLGIGFVSSAAFNVLPEIFALELRCFLGVVADAAPPSLSGMSLMGGREFLSGDRIFSPKLDITHLLQ
ncbi:hypothetical protein NUACC26_041020 [Scytonema sp. NUACC26]